jgi:pimeloyl-ACP methyl ester carboxylesterase
MSASQLHVNVLGEGSPAVVLEPGLGASSVGWSPVQRHAAATGRTRVITYDRAGLGASPPRPGPRGLRALATDLARVMETAGGGPAVVVGHSLGATIARQLTATRPDLVTGLVLIDTIPEPWVLRCGRAAAPIGSAMYRTLETIARAGLIDAVTALPPFAGITASSTSPRTPFADTERAQLAQEMRRPLSHRSARRELSGLLRSRTDLHALAAAYATDLPLTVISAGHTPRLAAPLRRAATTWGTIPACAGPMQRRCTS